MHQLLQQLVSEPMLVILWYYFAAETCQQNYCWKRYMVKLLQPEPVICSFACCCILEEAVAGQRQIPCLSCRVGWSHGAQECSFSWAESRGNKLLLWKLKKEWNSAGNLQCRGWDCWGRTWNISPRDTPEHVIILQPGKALKSSLVESKPGNKRKPCKDAIGRRLVTDLLYFWSLSHF